MKPTTPTAMGRDILIDALVEIVRHRFVVELDADGADLLLDGDEIGDVQQVFLRTDAETPDFGVAGMEEEQPITKHWTAARRLKPLFAMPRLPPTPER